MNILRSSLLLLILGLTSCATSVSSHQQAVALATRATGVSNPHLYWVPSSGAIADATFVTMSKAAPSRMAHDLASMFKTVGANLGSVVVSGPGSRKAGQVCADALRLQTNPLPGLTVVFIGTAEDAEAARQAAAKAQCRFHHVLPQ